MNTPRIRALPVFVAVALHLALTSRAVAGDDDTISCATLLREMADLQRLTTLPSPSYTTRQFSSYDQAPRKFGSTHEDWWRDNDRGYYLAVDDEESVLMEAEGPGAVVRIWSANPAHGAIRFYIDSADTPTWELPMGNLLTGPVPLGKPFAGVRARGKNLYFPITSARHCRVTVEGEPDMSYHVDSRTYDSSVSMRSFTPAVLEDLDTLIDSVAAVLTDTLRWRDMPADSVHRVVLGSCESCTIPLPAGPAALTSVQIACSSSALGAFLRGTSLRIVFDGDTAPQVELPLGELFGAAPRFAPYWSYPCAVRHDTTLCIRWHMPYRDSGLMTLTKSTQHDATLGVRMRSSPCVWTDSSMYFHAYWRQDTSVFLSERPEHAWFMVSPPRDHDMIDIQGRGVYVGTVLQVYNTTSHWWGEGDERIYVDNEGFPSWFGTGTEDYFGYAWSSTERFSHAYHAQPHSDGHGGFTTNLRWHILDAIPFTGRLRFDMEIQLAYSPGYLDYGRAVFFYALPGATTDHDGLQGHDLYLHREPVAIAAGPDAAPPAGGQTAAVPIAFDLRGRRLDRPPRLAQGPRACGVYVVDCGMSRPAVLIGIRSATLPGEGTVRHSATHGR